MRVSYSAANTFKGCPTKYYLQKKFRPPMNSSALPFGKAVEDGVEVLVKTKNLTKALSKFKKEWHTNSATKFGPPKPIFDNVDLFYYGSDYDSNLLTDHDWHVIKDWSVELCNGIEYDEIIDRVQKQIKNNQPTKKEERKLYHRACWLCCRRRGLYMIRGFYENILPDIVEVLAIQKEIAIKNGDGDTITGYIDYILKVKQFEDPIIFDLKTAGQLYEEHNLATSDQLRVYAAAEGIRHIGYLVLLKQIKCEKSCDKCGHVRENYRLKKCEKCGEGKYTINKSLPVTQTLVRKVSEEELDDILNDFSDIVAAISNNVKWKNPASCFNYGAKCEYYDVCWNNKKIETLKQEIESKKGE